MADAGLFNWLRTKKQEWSGKKQARLTQKEVNEFNNVLYPELVVVAEKPEKPHVISTITSVKGPLVAIVGSLAATSLFATVPAHEGTVYKAYKDIAGVTTICQGDTTNVHMGMIETPEGCRLRLERQLVIHAKGVMACTPRLEEEGHEWQRAAAVSLAYNIGVGAYCRSSVDRYWDKGLWKEGCDSFMSWNKARVNGVLRPVTGLTKRRADEHKICLKGLA
jgi:lysozyme